NYNFTAKVVGSYGNSLTANCSINIAAPPPLHVQCPGPAGNGNVGQYYTSAFTGTGGVPPYTFSIVSGSLPPGLSMTSSGAVTGVPTTQGNYSLSLQVVG